MLAKIAYWVCVAVFFAAMYTLICWVTTSFVMTANGPIKWSEGWAATKTRLLKEDE